MTSLRLTLALAALFSVSSAFAQDAAYIPPAARTYSGNVLAPRADSRAAAVARFLNGRGIAVSADSLVEVATTQALNGVSVVRFEERAAGLAIHAVYAKAAFNTQGELVHLIENLVPTSNGVAPGRISATQALAVALQRQYGTGVAIPPQARAQGNTVVFAQTPFFHDAPTATRVALVVNGSLQTAMLVETWSERQNLLHHTLVGGAGDVLGVELRTNTDRYNVFAVSPKTSIQGVVTGPAAVSVVGTVPSPAGWLGSGSQNTVNITGNNAHSYLDTDANNRVDKGGTSVTNGDFLTAWGGSGTSPSTTTNKAVAVQNLFYLNNAVHDILYTHGFTEGAGNFQQNNFGRGGSGNDPVQAEAQDGSGTDNANFSTPADGRAPRMQMYLWSNPAPDHEVVVNASQYGAKKADFTPSLTTTGISGTMVLVNDGVGTATDGCEPMSGLTGKIALIDRGTCSFKTKVVYAQNAGAVAVVVANNQGGDTIFVMGDDPAILNRIKIPAVMISQNSGTAVKSAIGGTGASSTVHKLAVTPPMIDASLDSDVVYHEYGHGLTWRMIGSMSGPLAGAIGEGASDGVALLINDDDAIGEFSASNAEGIRSAPYGSMTKTYKDVTGAEVHDDGEVFGEIVYRMKQLAPSYSVSNGRLFDLYVDGMNHTPSRPAWEDMRDGMLFSAGSDANARCVIWTAFASAGVGEGANGVENADGTVTITESFTKPASACP